MIKLNANIIGVGDIGRKSTDEIVSGGLLGFRTAVLCEVGYPRPKAEHIFGSKHDFSAKADVFFSSPSTAVFVLLDASGSVDVSLSCEIAHITSQAQALSVAVVFMPSSCDESYEKACEHLEELHEVFDGVVRFNAGYISSFETEVVKFFEVLSRAMDSQSSFALESFDDVKSLLTRKKDIYFACTQSHENMDSHEYNAKCLELKLSHQTYLDIANTLNFFYQSGGSVNEAVLGVYSSAISKVNIAFLSDIKTYISDNNLELSEGEFVFAVICAE